MRNLLAGHDRMSDLGTASDPEPSMRQGTERLRSRSSWISSVTHRDALYRRSRCTPPTRRGVTVPEVAAGGSVTLVLDAGAFVAQRGDRDVVALVKRERLAGRVPVTSG